MKIRLTTKDDMNALGSIAEAAGLFPADMISDMPKDDDIWLTCEFDEQPTGFAFARLEYPTEDAWNMLAIGVDPAQQRSGTGKALVAQIEAELREKGGRILIVDTSGTDDFAPARKFYETLGYEAEARIRDYWADGDDKVIFRKVL